jgi:3-methyladenine DNA glycosylase AlkC
MMAEALKNIYNETFIEALIAALDQEYSLFDSEQFRTHFFEEGWENLALKQRMRKITVCLKDSLPEDYQEALQILYKIAPQFNGLGGIIFPDYVEQYGLQEWDESMHALAYFTEFSTSEFAVRPFLIKDGKRMLEQMLKWSTHSNEHVRRLSSEGSRPRLPWGAAVPSLKEDPRQTLPILENLKNDHSLYVRKSVANHLNDISYTHSEFVLSIANEWIGKNKYTDWIIKHACRSLLKKGNREALALFGYGNDRPIKIEHLTLHPDTIQIGDSIQFTFHISAESTIPVRVEYAIDYVKSRGQRNRKIFMLKTFHMKQGGKNIITKTHHFKDLTTRKHYKGIHTLSIVINGAVKAEKDFIIK